MKKLTNLIALVMLVSVNVLTPFSYAQTQPSEGVGILTESDTENIVENTEENVGELVENDLPLVTSEDFQKEGMSGDGEEDESGILEENLLSEGNATGTEENLKIEKEDSSEEDEGILGEDVEDGEDELSDSQDKKLSEDDDNPEYELQLDKPDVITVKSSNSKDIVLEATSTAANQKLKINKYFANAYTVEWGDGTTGNLTADTTHAYPTAGTYTITLSLSGADRWTFKTNYNDPLIPKNGTTVTDVKIAYMPSLADGFGDSETNPGNYFFNSFNYDGQLTSLPSGSFDTSNIMTVGDSFFNSFNYDGQLTSLPEGSFDTSNITTVGNNFFYSFNRYGKLTSLPSGSFDTSNITTVGDSFFSLFNYRGQLTSLPSGSFDTSNITTVGNYFFSNFNRDGQLTSLPEGSFRFSSGLTTVGSDFFYVFNDNGQLTSLPSGSFDTSNITTVGNGFFDSFNFNGQLTRLPEGSFRLSTGLTTVGGSFFSEFNYDGQLTSLPEGSFDTSKITTVGNSFFKYFNMGGKLTRLPEGSFDTSKITTVGVDFFSAFNRNGQLTSLPEGSFRLSTGLTTVGDDFFSEFNRNGALTSLPSGSFDISKITTVRDDFFFYFNSRGQLTSLPSGSFDTSNITTVGSYFFSNFNYDGQLTSLPEGSFRLSTGLTTVGNSFFYRFNSSGALISLPDGSFNIGNINKVGTSFFTSFNYSGALTSLPEGSFDASNITTAGNSFFNYFNCAGAITNLPDSFKLSSAAYYQTYSYQNAFNSPNYTINRNVSDLVLGVTAPSSDQDTFSDNQPGRCGVDANWLVNPATACKTVTFETNSGTLVDSQIVDIDVNEKVVKPTDPTKTGHTFSEWYNDENLTEMFDFSTVVTGDTTLYAKWTINEYTLTLNVDGTLTVITGEYGSPITKPSDPEKNGYRFIGWEPEIPDTMPAEDMTVRAKWEKLGSSGGGGGGGGGGGSTKPDTPKEEQKSADTSEQDSHPDGQVPVESQNDNSNTQDSQQSTQLDGAEQASTSASEGQTYTPEFQEAYEFAKGKGITTMPTIQQAKIDGKLTRIAMAKMLSYYAINVLGQTPDTSKTVKFKDVTSKKDADYDNGVILAYQLGIMGQNMPNNKFRPNDEVTRAEFATSLSRMIYNTSDGEYKSTSKYYIHHMEKLVKEGIITNDDPKMKERRGYVMIMLMRSAE